MITNILKKLKIKENQPLIIGVSAGPDSMALLHLLKTSTNNKLICAHINHGIRKESEKEQNYLKNYCKKNNIIFESTKITKYEENNFENEARKKRYTFYEEILKKYNSKYLFLAHHGDDLIETILMKIERTSSIEGYAGIKEITKRNNYLIIRPLLNYTKQDLINYNHKYNITYFLDSTNEDTTYTRNRYRLKILPLLKEEDRNIHKKYLTFSKNLLEYHNYLEEQLENIYPNIIKTNKINLTKFNKLHPLIKKNLLYKYLNNNYNNIPNIIKEKNIQNILSLIENKKPNLSINLPQKKQIIKTYNTLYLKEINKKSPNYKQLFEKEITIHNFTIKKITKTKEDGNNICKLNSKNISLPLYIRNRLPGDKIEVLGLNGTKKVKEIFIENKIPLHKRDTYPILVDKNDQIIWIPNLKKSKFNSQNNEFYDIILKCWKKEENNE